MKVCAPNYHRYNVHIMSLSNSNKCLGCYHSLLNDIFLLVLFILIWNLIMIMRIIISFMSICYMRKHVHNIYICSILDSMFPCIWLCVRKWTNQLSCTISTSLWFYNALIANICIRLVCTFERVQCSVSIFCVMCKRKVHS